MLDSIISYLASTSEFIELCSYPEGVVYFCLAVLFDCVGIFVGVLIMFIMSFVYYRSISRQITELKKSDEET